MICNAHVDKEVMAASMLSRTYTAQSWGGLWPFKSRLDVIYFVMQVGCAKAGNKNGYSKFA